MASGRLSGYPAVMKWIIPVALLGLAGACVQVEPVSLDDLDRGDTNSATTAYGSGWLRPRQDWRIDDPEARFPAEPSAREWPELPRERIARIRAYMTEAELFELLGEPMREDVELQGIDSDENDWNATVYTWRYLDSRFGAPIERDLEVRLAWVHNGRSLPARPEVVGPDWVVLSHSLY